jgi:FtsP/CotA-like multicopper oxidase with cupredoxin domain
MRRTTLIHSRRRGLGWALSLTGFILLLIQGPLQAATYNLYADVTSLTLPDTGEVVTMWGFGLQGGPVTIPGPVLTVPPGDTTLTINLRNNLTGVRTGLGVDTPVSLVIPGQAMPQGYSGPVRFGAAPYLGRIRSLSAETPSDNTTIVTYTWNNLKPGTYIYHSGTHLQAQVQMGLYGGVKKDAGFKNVYNIGTSAYDSEALIFLSEIDPAFHQAVASNNFGPGKAVTSTINYHPKYFLINGRPYSQSTPPPPLLISGANVLLRFLNAGLQTHVPMLYGGGTYLKVLAENGNLYPYVKEEYALTLPALGTADAIINPTVVGSLKLFDRRLNLTNAAATPGGMLTYLNYGMLSYIFIPLVLN